MVKIRSITDNLRHRIVTGDFPPGGALPMRQELLTSYGISVATFQKTINTLIAEGFLVSCRGSGVFIRTDPPHRFRLGLALPVESLASMEQDSLWEALFRTAESYRFEGERVTLEPYCTGKGDIPGCDGERLYEDAQKHRLCGVVQFRSRPKLKLPEEFPCVRFEYLPNDASEQCIRMATNHVRLFEMALEDLTSHGVKSVAVVFQVSLNIPTLLRIRELAENSGLYMPQEWMLPLDCRFADTLSYGWLVSGLFSENAKRVPEGIAVLNENLLPVVMTQLNRLGKIPGRDVEIVSHCNRPTNRPQYDGVHYIGPHAEDILSAYMERIRAYRPEPSEITYIEPKRFS